VTGSTAFALEQLLAEKDAEIERLKTQQEGILLKHAKEQSIALSTLLTALKEIERLRALVSKTQSRPSSDFFGSLTGSVLNPVTLGWILGGQEVNPERRTE
jgi:hypothetical protein